MRKAMFHIGLALALVILVRLPVSAQPRSGSAPRANAEPLFLLYAAEDLFRSNGPTLAKNVQANPFQLIPAWVLSRKTIVDRVRRQASGVKGADVAVEAIRRYERHLALWEAFGKEMLELQTRVDKSIGAVRAAQASRALGVGLIYGLSTARKNEGDAFLQGFTGALAEYARTARVVAAARDRILAQAREDAEALNKTYMEKIANLRKENLNSIEEAARPLEKERGLAETEVARQWKGKSANAVSNPFLVAAAAGKQLGQAKSDPADDAKAARECIRAVTLVPSSKAYDVYRAAFYSLAGQLANRAAAADLGTTGFTETHKKRAKPPVAGALAYNAWNRYLKQEPLDAKSGSDFVIHQLLLAHGHAGKLRNKSLVIVANQVLKPQRTFSRIVYEIRPEASSRPEFWYDCARAYSVRGDLAMSLKCFQTAMQTGYKDTAKADSDIDLRAVRSSALTRDQFKRALERKPRFGFGFDR